MVHELKTLPQYFNDVESYVKKFEIRKNDRDFKLGDFLELKEWDDKAEQYTGRKISRCISYILKGGKLGLKRGYCILGLEMPW